MRERLRKRYRVLAIGLLVGTALALTVKTDASPAQGKRAVYQMDIVVMNAEGSGRTQLTRTRADETNAEWSPDSTRIVFERTSVATQDIFVIQVDGGGLTNLTNSRRGVEEYPSWSPDGTKILFAAESAGGSDVFSIGSDGSNRTNLTHSDAAEFGPVWSPDGQRIAFGVANDDDYTTDIHVMNADGSGRKRLTRTEGKGLEDFVYAWSPDSAKILFGRVPVGLGSPPFDIWVMRADGSGKANLTARPASASDTWATWSPDGAKIAFASDRKSPRTDNWEIYVMNADGGGKANLTRNKAFDTAPAWSPDGTRIAFSSKRGSLKNFEIVVMRADGNGQTNLTRSASEESSPAWAPDGERVLFLNAPAQFCRVPKVTGLSLRRTYNVLSRANCSVGAIRRVESTAPKERVLRQDPRPGTRLPYGGRVNLVVSTGAR